MNKKGFTLIELLAVIVILAIIALIAVPAVLNIIEDSRISATKESARNIARAAETYYMQGVMKGNTPDSIDLTGDVLNYNGEKPEKGMLTYDETGRAYIKMYMNGYCVLVDYDNTVSSEKMDKSECKLNAVILSIDAKGGEVSEVSREYGSGDELGELPNANKEGYTFNGWTLVDGTIVTSTTKITENMTINASYTAKTYTVTLNDGDNSTTDSTMIVTYDSTYGEINVPTRKGYNFLGWKLSDGTDITNESIVKLAENHTLYAQWEQIVINTSGMSLVLSVENSNRGYILYGEIEGSDTDTNLISVKYEIYFAESIYSADEELLDTITMTNASENFAFEYEYESNNFPAMEMFKVIAYVSETNTLIREESIETECFVAGTKVLTENGYVNIENIKKGDMVYSYNLDTNELELKEVTRTVVSSAIDTYKMTIGTEVVEMSVKHELYLIDKGWVRAYKVEVGDKMLDSKGNEIEITNIEYIKYNEPIKTYNLTVDENHNYFVTNIQALVHNTLSNQ